MSLIRQTFNFRKHHSEIHLTVHRGFLQKAEAKMRGKPIDFPALAN
jgi:hypothetical protein